MGAAGHPATKNMTGEPSHWNQYTVVVNAAPGQAVELTLEAVWLAPSQQLLITADGDGSSAVTLVGHELPAAVRSRKYRSRVGGSVTVVLSVPTNAPPASSFFSIRIASACTEDSSLSGTDSHGPLSH
jgi:hypothetical protein